MIPRRRLYSPAGLRHCRGTNCKSEKEFNFKEQVTENSCHKTWSRRHCRTMNWLRNKSNLTKDLLIRVLITCKMQPPVPGKLAPEGYGTGQSTGYCSRILKNGGHTSPVGSSNFAWRNSWCIRTICSSLRDFTGILGENSGPISPRLDTSKLLKLIIWCKDERACLTAVSTKEVATNSGKDRKQPITVCISIYC